MPKAKYARASDMMIAGAARRLIDECKDGDSMIGGLSYNIGKPPHLFGPLHLLR